jgi:hypothetical protein
MGMTTGSIYYFGVLTKLQKLFRGGFYSSCDYLKYSVRTNCLSALYWNIWTHSPTCDQIIVCVLYYSWELDVLRVTSIRALSISRFLGRFRTIFQIQETFSLLPQYGNTFLGKKILTIDKPLNTIVHLICGFANGKFGGTFNFFLGVAQPLQPVGH